MIIVINQILKQPFPVFAGEKLPLSLTRKTYPVKPVNIYKNDLRDTTHDFAQKPLLNVFTGLTGFIDHNNHPVQCMLFQITRRINSTTPMPTRASTPFNPNFGTLNLKTNRNPVISTATI